MLRRPRPAWDWFLEAGPAVEAGVTGNASEPTMQVAVTDEGEMPNFCVPCGQGFQSPRNLKLHNARKHGPKIHACKECPEEYGLLDQTPLR